MTSRPRWHSVLQRTHATLTATSTAAACTHTTLHQQQRPLPHSQALVPAVPTTGNPSYQLTGVSRRQSVPAGVARHLGLELHPWLHTLEFEFLLQGVSSPLQGAGSGGDGQLA